MIDLTKLNLNIKILLLEKINNFFLIFMHSSKTTYIKICLIFMHSYVFITIHTACYFSEPKVLFSLSN